MKLTIDQCRAISWAVEEAVTRGYTRDADLLRTVLTEARDEFHATSQPDHSGDGGEKVASTGSLAFDYAHAVIAKKLGASKACKCTPDDSADCEYPDCTVGKQAAPVPQDGDERAAFEAWFKTSGIWNDAIAWKTWQARAALSTDISEPSARWLDRTLLDICRECEIDGEPLARLAHIIGDEKRELLFRLTTPIRQMLGSTPLQAALSQKASPVPQDGDAGNATGVTPEMVRAAMDIYDTKSWCRTDRMRASLEAALAQKAVPIASTAPMGDLPGLSEGYRRGIKDAFHLVNMLNANRQGRTAEETCSYIVRTLAEQVNSGEAPTAPVQSAEPVAWALKIADGRLDMTDATDPPTDRHHDWAERHSHRYVPLNAAQYAMLQEILK